MRSGTIALALAAVAAVTLVDAGAPRAARLVVLPILYFGALGIFQARGRT